MTAEQEIAEFRKAFKAERQKSANCAMPCNDYAMRMGVCGCALRALKSLEAVAGNTTTGAA